MRTLNMPKWIDFAVGYVFLTSGILKLVSSDFQATFQSIGLPYPGTMLLLVALTEIACSAFILSQSYVKHAAAPLILIILGALYLTKLPVLMNEGLLRFAFDARLDIVMLILLILLWQHRSDKQL